jgi:hypothetical protein
MGVYYIYKELQRKERYKDMKADTYGYGLLELLTDNEPYEYSKGYNDAVIEGVTYSVGESEETGKLVEVRERKDGSLFAVLVDA